MHDAIVHQGCCKFLCANVRKQEKEEEEERRGWDCMSALRFKVMCVRGMQQLWATCEMSPFE